MALGEYEIVGHDVGVLLGLVVKVPFDVAVDEPVTVALAERVLEPMPLEETVDDADVVFVDAVSYTHLTLPTNREV